MGGEAVVDVVVPSLYAWLSAYPAPAYQAHSRIGRGFGKVIEKSKCDSVKLKDFKYKL